MVARFGRAGLTVAGLAVIAAGLGGCMSNTYGTGVSPGKQTVNDIAGLVNLNGSRKDPIDYKPRPGIVAPPASAALPPPGSQAVASASGDWPNDPDAAMKARKAAAAKLRTGDAKIDAQYDPDLPITAQKENKINWNDPNKDGPGVREGGSAAQDEEVRKLIADAKSAVSVDSNGNPIRKTLSEPPVAYRAPDPNAPTEFKAAKKFHFPWQKLKPDDPKATLTDDSADAAASKEKTTQ